MRGGPDWGTADGEATGFITFRPGEAALLLPSNCRSRSSRKGPAAVPDRPGGPHGRLQIPDARGTSEDCAMGGFIRFRVGSQRGTRGFIRFRVGFGREALCQSYHAPVVTLAVTGGSGDRGVKEGRQATLKTHSEEGAAARVGASVVGALPSTRREPAGTFRRAPPLTPRHGPSGRYAARSAGRAGAASRSCRGPAGDQEPPGRH